MARQFSIWLIISCLLSASSPNQLTAQELPFFHYTSRDEKQPLPASGVNEIFQDRLGFLWISCLGAGLTRYDGQRMKQFGPEEGLNSMNVASLAEDEAGRLWVGTDNGLFSTEEPLQYYRNGRQPRFTSGALGQRFVQNNFSPNTITTDSEGAIWAGTQALGAIRYRWDEQGIQADTFPAVVDEDDSSKTVYSILGLANGAVAAGMVNGHLLRFTPEGGRFKAWLSEGQRETLGATITALAEGPDGQLWGGCHSGLLWRLDETNGQPKVVALDAGVRNWISSIKVSADGQLWACSNGDGLVQLSTRSPEWSRLYGQDNGLLSNLAYHVLLDREGNLWIGQDQGLSKLRPNYQSFLNYPGEGEGTLLPAPTVTAALPPGNGRSDDWLWAGTAGGIAVIDTASQKAHFIRQEEGLDGAVIYSLGAEAGGCIWVGLDGKTAAILPAGQPFPKLGEFKSRPLQIFDEDYRLEQVRLLNVYAIQPASLPTSTGPQETLWFLSYKKIACLAGEQWFTFRQQAGFPVTASGSMATSQDGQVWIGTDDHGIFRSRFPLSFDTLAGLHRSHAGDGDLGREIAAPVFEAFWNKKSGAPTNNIQALLAASGKLWVGTPQGIYILQLPSGKQLAHLTTETGLRNHNTFSLCYSPDSSTIWAGTKSGLAAIDRISLKASRLISRKDGLLDDEVSFHNSVTTGSEGSVYFGNTRGLSIYRPQVPRPQLPPPLARITDFQYTEEGGDRNLLTVSYAGLSFVNEEAVRFRTRLLGYNRKWTAPSVEAKARYTNLPATLFPRTYTFEVRAANEYGYWSEEAAAHSFQVRPAWYLSWWAFLIYALAITALLLFFIRWRTRQQRQALARERQVSNRLRQLDRLKDQFLANTSHELRTPLNGIIGLAQSLKEGAAGKLPGSAVENLEMITASGRRLASLVNDILDYSKLKNQELKLNRKAVDIFTVVDVVLDLTRPLVRSKELELRNDVPKELPLVFTDENRLQQILHNLIGNAVKFTDEGSVSVSARQQEDNIAVSVSDTGIGIPDDKLEDIFRSFEQIEGSSERTYGGTGLGLSISKQLIELQGGEIHVESAVGEGSVFTFTLPIARAEASTEASQPKPSSLSSAQAASRDRPPEEQKTAKPQSVPSADKGLSILVVDDEVVNRRVLRNFLSMEGYEVVEASNGPEALKLIDETGPFDLAILDIMMPKMSGYEVCRRLREKYLPSELPVIMLTAKGQLSDLVEGFNAGANDYLAKPFRKEELLSRIRTHLNLHYINKATGKFVPYEFIRTIGRDSITEVQLGDQAEREVTVFFSDIRGYTSLAEQMSPEENFRFVNAYVNRMGPIIKRYRGFVNQYLGDAIMAIFQHSPADALQAAIGLQQELRKYNEERAAKERNPIRAGVGMHTGPLIMGIIGDEHRTEPATISDTVNTAARMEGLTKYYGANILLSENTLAGIEEVEKFKLRYLGKVQVKGKQQALGLYECFDGDPPGMVETKSATLPTFQKGVDAYLSGQFDTAVKLFREVLGQQPEDQVAQYFLDRIQLRADKGPPEDWSGVEMMDKK